jgi:hypothetical protein
MPVTALLAAVPGAELTEWAAYERMTGPLGPARVDMAAGIVAATVANVNRGKGKRSYKPADFMPKFDRIRHSGADAMRKALKVLTAKLGGKIRTGGD